VQAAVCHLVTPWRGLGIDRSCRDVPRGVQHPDLEVDQLDLWDGSLPVYGGKGADAKLVAVTGQTPTGELAEAWAEVQAVFDRFNAAEIYLFTVPMWNAGVP
jgi:FMN-dependent NADH-azoreductase